MCERQFDLEREREREVTGLLGLGGVDSVIDVSV